jgi:prepilin-type N-terminal cleavage/methylation domain-containing protein
MNRRAFSLVELLIVLAVVALLMGLGVASLRRDQRGAQVQAAAEELAGTLRKARAMAMRDQAVYGIAFNIQNEPGSSGAVLNNRSGGHWYRIIGPAKTLAQSTNLAGNIPYPMNLLGGRENWNFPDYLYAISIAWVAEKTVLPARKVRFLALSDTDEGPRFPAYTSASIAGTGNYGDAGEMTYPRPWFGYFDRKGGRLWPWGGYDPAKAHSGFFYQGSGPAISGCRNMDDRIYDNSFAVAGADRDADYADAKDLNGDGDTADLGEVESKVPIWRTGEPRPLVNADWLDAVIVFLPDGRARYLEWGRGRRFYSQGQVGALGKGGNGVRDLTRIAFTNSQDSKLKNQAFDNSPVFAPLSQDRRATRTTNPCGPGEVRHFNLHTGGWHLTLAPDALDDQDTFASEQEALESISPMWRVFIGENGSIRAFPVAQRPGWPMTAATIPSTPADWLDAAWVWKNCRYGYPHDPTTNGEILVPTPIGRPITDVISTSMLCNKVWWTQP